MKPIQVFLQLRILIPHILRCAKYLPHRHGYWFFAVSSSTTCFQIGIAPSGKSMKIGRFIISCQVPVPALLYITHTSSTVHVSRGDRNSLCP